MRVRFADYTIVLCKQVFKKPGSDSIMLTTVDNEQITVDCRNSLRANDIYNTLLFDGYFDALFLDIIDRRKLS